MPGQRIFFSSETACKYWNYRSLDETLKTRAVPTPLDKQSSAAISDARHLLFNTEDAELLHVSVASQDARHRIKNAVIHKRNVPYPDWSFRKIARDTFVASPELCFLEAAQVLPLKPLILYGMELCGTYTRTQENAFQYQREPLTSTKKLGAYISKSKGASNVLLASRAVKYIMNESASARESVLALAMSLPNKLGGFGMPQPLLNYGIKVNARNTYGDQLILHGDIVWPDAALVVEYDGAQHGIENNHADDKRRDHLLLEAGFEVVRFTDKTLRNGIELERLARTINRKAHLKRPRSSFEWDMRKEEALNDLLFRSNPPWV